MATRKNLQTLVWFTQLASNHIYEQFESQNSCEINSKGSKIHLLPFAYCKYVEEFVLQVVLAVIDKLFDFAGVVLSEKLG